MAMEILDLAVNLTPAQACQAFYVLTSVVILVTKQLPSDLRDALMNYGARHQDKKQQSSLAGLIDCTQVPHSWFSHFYILSVGWSAFWAWQYLTRGAIMEWLAVAQARDGKSSVDISQVFLAWALMAFQGSRRLYECFCVMKPGKSPMSSIHWIVALVYYTDMGISVWIEGSGAILESWESGQLSLHPSKMLPVGIGLFMIGWIKQNECHRHLASLKKYTLPHQSWFRYIVCAHYTSECLVYLGLSIVAAPPDKIFSRTVALGLLFVAMNLGATAGTTKQWYAEKFGADKVADKWKMIPLVY